VETCFTLFVVPSFYLVLARDHRKDGERLSEVESPEAGKLEPALA
jgi:hypothetical protein